MVTFKLYTDYRTALHKNWEDSHHFGLYIQIFEMQIAQMILRSCQAQHLKVPWESELPLSRCELASATFYACKIHVSTRTKYWMPESMQERVQ
jgi:hypothetical protein